MGQRTTARLGQRNHLAHLLGMVSGAEWQAVGLPAAVVAACTMG